MRMPRSTKSGYALIVVLSVLALLVVSLVTVDTSVSLSRLGARRGAQQMNRSEATAAVLALALAADPATTSPLTLTPPAGASAKVTREPLPPGHSFWSQRPCLRPLAGDERVTLTWPDDLVQPEQYLVNHQGLRRGAINLGGQSTPAIQPAEKAVTQP